MEQGFILIAILEVSATEHQSLQLVVSATSGAAILAVRTSKRLLLST